MNGDQAATAIQAKAAAAYGDGSTALPWAQIIAMLMQIFSGCIKPPTPAEVRSQAKTLLGKIKAMRGLHRQGIYGQKAERVYDAGVAALDASTDEEVSALVTAAQDGE
jgi:hypothetical protein